MKLRTPGILGVPGIRRLRPRHVVTVVLACAMVGLAVGPVKAMVDGTATPPSLVEAPLPRPTLAAWPTGVWDTSSDTPTALPAASRLTYADAATQRPDGAYVAVDGRPTGRGLTGVGGVLTDTDLQRLVDLGAADATTVVDRLAGVDGAAFGVLALGGEPDAASRVVSSTVGRRYRADTLGRLAGSEQGLAAMLWVQHRPDLRLVVPDPDAATTASGASGSKPVAADASLQAIVTRLVVPGLTERTGVLAPQLFAGDGSAAAFTLTGTDATPTMLGRALTVAAHAVTPGSKVVPVHASGLGSLAVKAFARPGGGGSVLVWNPGNARSLTVDLPAGRRVERYQVQVPAHALTSVVVAGS